MSLTARERRVLAGIEARLCCSDPRLAAMLTSFAVPASARLHLPGIRPARSQVVQIAAVAAICVTAVAGLVLLVLLLASISRPQGCPAGPRAIGAPVKVTCPAAPGHAARAASSAPGQDGHRQARMMPGRARVG